MNIVKANIDYKLIGQRIRDARKEKKWSQEKLSEILDVGVVYISRIERGTSKASLRRLADIALALDVPLEKLITGITVESNTYIDKKFYDVLSNCSPDKQELIYNIAKIVSGLKFV